MLPVLSGLTLDGDDRLTLGDGLDVTAPEDGLQGQGQYGDLLGNKRKCILSILKE